MDDRALLDLLPVGLAEVASDGRLLARNPAAVAMLARCAASTLETLPLADDERASLRQGDAVVTLLLDGSACELRLVGADRSLLLLLADASALHAAQARAAAGERARGLGELVSGIVHDLSNHFGVALGLGEQLLPLARDAEDRRLITVMQQGVRNGDALLKAVATMLRLSPRKRQVVGLAGLVRDVLLLFGKMAVKRGNSVKIDAIDDVLQVRVVMEEAMSALLHGCTATLLAMPQSGAITVQVLARTLRAANGRERSYGCVLLGGGQDGAAFAAVRAAAQLDTDAVLRAAMMALAGHELLLPLLAMRQIGGDLCVEPGPVLVYRFPAAGAAR